jgi:20S proteasome alpha/beta subunit
VQFCELVQRNVALNEFRSGLRASTHSATSYVRNELHSALRQNPFQVNLLIAGFDSSAPGSSISGYKSASASSASSSAAAGSNAAAAGTAAASAPLSAMEAATRSVTAQGSASLYFLDYLGSSQKMNFAAHGYASYFIFSTLDRHWRAGMSEAQALELVKLCVKELKTRFLMHQPNWKVKVCDANGTREVAFDASAL